MIVILGGGESGVGAALLAKHQGEEVFVSDRGSLKEKYKTELEKNDIPYEENQHTISKILDADLVVKSPGIPDHIDLIRGLKMKGMRIVSEIEFATKYARSKIIAITGSNGKTTTTKLTYHLLKEADLDVRLGGNIGHSFARLVANDPGKYYVLELSSFQLDGIENFRPDIAVLLNITPDHLDRYGYELAAYAKSKCSIAKNQEEDDVFIYNDHDQNIDNYMNWDDLEAEKIAVGFSNQVSESIRVGRKEFDMTECALKGPHNQFNASVAIQIAQQLNVSKEDIQKGLNSFVNEPHRLELVESIYRVDYYNDSKATNVDAVYYALAAMTRPTIWIVGGTDKGNDYSRLFSLVQEKVKAIICLGVDNSKIIDTFKDKVEDITETQSAADAVKMAFDKSTAGDAVLLSPACASFDLFKNYIDRGDQFKKAVRSLKK